MKTICVLALGALVAGCHLDKLIGGSGGGPHPTSSAPPVALVFMVPPRNAQVGEKIPVQVSVVDAVGVPVAETTTVFLTLSGNSNGAKLLGDTTAPTTRGVASFGNIAVDKPDSGYTLIARAPGLRLPDKTSETFKIMAPPLTTGSLTVTTSTTGLSLDLDGYTVTVDGSTSQSIGSNDSTGVTFPGVQEGTHSVMLSGVALNCSVSGGTTHTVIVPAGGAVTEPFSVSCTQIPPTTGDLTVTTNTTGQNPDPDGYTVTVDGSSQPIATTNSTGITFPRLPAGNHQVQLSGMASNCAVSGSNPRTVNVVAGSGGSTDFSVTCTAPPTGSVTVGTTTTGPDAPSGYTATVDNDPGKSVAANGSVTFDGLSVASHSVRLSPIPSNCSVSGANPQTVSVTAGTATPANFTINCTATTGDLIVTTTTGGADLDPDGYTVSAGGTSQPISTNDTYTFRGLPAGTQNVALSGIASNCTVTNSNPMSVNVPAGGTGHADFAISCTALPPPVFHPPVVNAGGDQRILFGSFTLNASFTDQDNDGPWGYTIDWGDGSSVSGTAQSPGPITRSHSYGLDLLGKHTVTVTVTDAHNLSGSASAVIDVVLSL